MFSVRVLVLITLTYIIEMGCYVLDYYFFTIAYSRKKSRLSDLHEKSSYGASPERNSVVSRGAPVLKEADNISFNFQLN